MSRYSSDSDSSNYHRQSRRKRRSPATSATSSDSSRHKRSKSSKRGSCSRYRKSKSSKRYGSYRSYRRSRSRSKNSSRRSRSASRSTERTHNRRSHSREKYRTKYQHMSRIHSNVHGTKHHSRSSSSESKNSTSSSNSSKSSSVGSKKSAGVNTKKNFSSDSALNPDEQLREKLLKAIKAAESADHQLKQQGVLPKCVKSRNDIKSNLTPSQPQSEEALRDINADVFVPKTFKSSKQGKEMNYDELNITTSDIDIPPTRDVENSVFHTSFFIDPKAKLDWWVKKLYQIRQKAISGEPFNLNS